MNHPRFKTFNGFCCKTFFQEINFVYNTYLTKSKLYREKEIEIFYIPKILLKHITFTNEKRTNFLFTIIFTHFDLEQKLKRINYGSNS